jgi:hypothetical protein
MWLAVYVERERKESDVDARRLPGASREVEYSRPRLVLDDLPK